MIKGKKKVKRRFMPKQKPHESVQVVGTPWDFFKALEGKFGKMSWDLAALSSNAKCKNYITPKRNTFRVRWHKLGGRLYVNPPFGNITRFVKRALRESKKGAHVFMLVPASVGANWFRDYVWKKATCWFMNGRIKFITHSQSYPKDTMVIEFHPAKPDLYNYVWDWKHGKTY